MNPINLKLNRIVSPGQKMLAGILFLILSTSTVTKEDQEGALSEAYSRRNGPSDQPKHEDALTAGQLQNVNKVITEKSLYLEWLRTQISPITKVKLIKAEVLSPYANNPVIRLTCLFNKKNVVIYMGQPSDGFSIWDVQVDGKSMNIELDKYLTEIYSLLSPNYIPPMVF
jgi:hypothetical protein